MKILIPYLLLCIYATAIIKPVIPTVSDIFAHLVNYHDHMITVHRHPGKSHVHFEYIEAAKKGSRGDVPLNNISRKMYDSNDYLMSAVITGFVPFTIPQKHPGSLLHSLPVRYPRVHFHPPIAFRN